MHKLIYILIMAIIVLAGCEISKTIDYDVNYPPDKLVITGFVGMENRAEAYISISNPPLSSDLKVLPQLEVTLFEDGNIRDNKTLSDDPLYISAIDFKADAGKSYSIRAKAEGYPEAVSEVETFPERVTIDSVSYSTLPENEILIKTYFTDPDEDNYYVVKIIMNYNDTLVSADYPLFILSSAFSDKKFRSGIGQVDRREYLWAGGLVNKPIYYNKADIILFTISKAGYDFCRSIDEADYTNGDIFTAPTIIESNIRNGYGIFMAYSTDTIRINLEK